jgi:hypothetical protein
VYPWKRPARLALSAFVGGASLAGTAPVRAADAVADPTSTFQYARNGGKDYFRTGLELGGVLAVGLVWYQYTASNTQDWDLGYDWPALRKKLLFEAVRFDTNRFDTNMLSHTMEGGVFYVAARANRLSIAESTLVSFTGSLLWEYAGELKEQASVNDLIVTPIAGAAVGEAATQLGAFFDRGRRTFTTEALGIAFGPTKHAHDWADDAEPRRATDADSLGFTREIGHAFETWAGGGVTSQSGRTRGTDARFGVSAEIQNVPGWNRPGSSSGWVTDGNFSRVGLETTWADLGLADLAFAATVAPAAWFSRDLREDARGPAALRGSRGHVGATLGFDYDLHRWDRTRPKVEDPISSVHLGGLDLDHELFVGTLAVRTRVHGHAGFGAVRSLALDGYVARGGDIERLPSIMRENSYYYAWTAALAPEIRARYGPLEAGARAQVDGYWGIDGLDRRGDVPWPVPLRDRRSFARAWIALSPIPEVRLTFGGDARLRTSAVADARSRATESSMFATLGWVF